MEDLPRDDPDRPGSAALSAGAPEGVRLDHAVRGPAACAVHDPGARSAYLGSLSRRKPPGPRPGLATPPRDRDRPHLRALRVLLRVGRARRVLRSTRRPDAGAAARDGARRRKRPGVERRRTATDPNGGRAPRLREHLRRALERAPGGLQRRADPRADRAGRLLPRGFVLRQRAEAAARGVERAVSFGVAAG